MSSFDAELPNSDDKQFFRDAMKNFSDDLAREKESQVRFDKLVNKLLTLEKSFQKFSTEVKEMPARDFFSSLKGVKYSNFDEQGLPLDDLDGKPLSNSALKAVKKDAEKHDKLRAEYLSILEKDPKYFEKIQNEMEELKRLRDGFHAQKTQDEFKQCASVSTHAHPTNYKPLSTPNVMNISSELSYQELDEREDFDLVHELWEFTDEELLGFVVATFIPGSKDDITKYFYIGIASGADGCKRRIDNYKKDFGMISVFCLKRADSQDVVRALERKFLGERSDDWNLFDLPTCKNRIRGGGGRNSTSSPFKLYIAIAENPVEN